MVTISGRTQLQRKLKQMPDAVVPELRAAIAQGAQEVVDIQKRLAPHGRTGKLAASIRWRYGDEAKAAYAGLKSGGPKGDPRTSAILSAGNTDVRYAHLVEFGTAPHPQGGIFAARGIGRLFGSRVMHPGTPPKPFFFPPFRAKKRAVKSRIGRAMTKAVRSVAKK